MIVLGEKGGKNVKESTFIHGDYDDVFSFADELRVRSNDNNIGGNGKTHDNAAGSNNHSTCSDNDAGKYHRCR